MIIASISASIVLDERVYSKQSEKIRRNEGLLEEMEGWTVGVRLLNEQISTLSGYSTQFAISQPGIDGLVTLSEVRVLHYNPPQVSVVNFLPPRYVIFGLENMDISLAGAFYGTGGPFQVQGFVDGSIVGMTVALTAEFATTADGMMNVQVDYHITFCHRAELLDSNQPQPFQPRSPGTDGTSPEDVRDFYGLINEGIRHRIPGMFCKKLKHLIEENSPRLFEKLVRTEFQEHFKDFRLIDSPVIKK
ncbi:hypothetical protein COOONC_06275 [Cooperia oncophora]